MATRKIYYIHSKDIFHDSSNNGHAVLTCSSQTSDWKLEIILYGKDYSKPCYVIQYRGSHNWQGETLMAEAKSSCKGKWSCMIHPEFPLYLDCLYDQTSYSICDERPIIGNETPPSNEIHKIPSEVQSNDLLTFSSYPPAQNQIALNNSDSIPSKDQVSLWDKLVSRYSMLKPFSMDLEAIAFSPKEIHRITTVDRSLEENSFLLHGYYQYRHILFFRRHEKTQKYTYYLGVPGIWQKQEKLVAEMFGFPNFLEKRTSTEAKLFSTAPANGAFGYYYRSLQAIPNIDDE